jgi:hypothetical protein
MSATIKTYDKVLLPLPARWPLYVLDDAGKPNKRKRRLAPGDWVTHHEQGGKGIVVAITRDEVSVLWSIEPEPVDLSRFAFPIIRRTFPTLRAQQLVSIQPMSVPSGAIFYMDYTYGSGSSGACPSGAQSTSDTTPGPDSGPTGGP